MKYFLLIDQNDILKYMYKIGTAVDNVVILFFVHGDDADEGPKLHDTDEIGGEALFQGNPECPRTVHCRRPTGAVDDIEDDGEEVAAAAFLEQARPLRPPASHWGGEHGEEVAEEGEEAQWVPASHGRLGAV